MATSFVDYQGHGFWCHDSDLEVWLGFAVEVLDGRGAELPPWLRQLREEWFLMASLGFVGCIELDLNKTLTDASRIAAVRELAAEANQVLAAHGSHITAQLLKSRPTKPPGLSWEGDAVTADFLTVGHLLRALLTGELTTTASSPLDYLVREQWRQLSHKLL